MGGALCGSSKSMNKAVSPGHDMSDAHSSQYDSMLDSSRRSGAAGANPTETPSKLTHISTNQSHIQPQSDNNAHTKHSSTPTVPSVRKWTSLDVDTMLEDWYAEELRSQTSLAKRTSSHRSTVSELILERGESEEKRDATEKPPPFIEPSHVIHGSDIVNIFTPVDDRILGRGVSCVVGEVAYCGMNYPEKKGKKYALKRMDRASDWVSEKWVHEVQILRQLEHDNIVKLDDVYMDDQYFYICTELCTGGPLLDRITRKVAFSEQDAAHIIKQLYRTLQYMHSKNIVHRDIKPANIVFDKEGEHGMPVIIDFGDALEVKESDRYDAVAGTVAYLAPETMKTGRTGFDLKQGDVWALGITAYIMLTGQLPYASVTTQTEVIKAIRNWREQYLDFPETQTELSPQCQDFFTNILRASPRLRFTAEQALAHEWLRDITSISPSALDDDVISQIQAFHRAENLKRIFVQGFIHQMTEEQKTWVYELFCQLDTNNRAYVTRGDVNKWLLDSGFKRDAAQRRVEEIFSLLDVDKDGKITLTEFVQGYARIRLSRAKTNDILNSVESFTDDNNHVNVRKLTHHLSSIGSDTDAPISSPQRLSFVLPQLESRDSDEAVHVKTIMNAIRSDNKATSMKDLFSNRALDTKPSGGNVFQVVPGVK